MASYNTKSCNVIKFKPGVITEANANLLDTLRLASIMVDPRCMALFGRMANPAQDRLAVDFPELRIQAIKQKLLEILAHDFVNNVNFNPNCQPDIQHWCEGADYDVSHPQEARSWIWVSQKLQYIKTGMSTLLANFHKSGDLENGMDDGDRDVLFWKNFCNQQPLWFWIYMCWQRGRNVPAWNTALVPDDQRLDITGEENEEAPDEVVVFCANTCS